MVTYIFYTVIIGKLEIDSLFCFIEEIWKIFVEKYVLNSTLPVIWLLSKSLNLIGCKGDIKRKFSKIIERHKGGEANTLHAWYKHYMLHKIYVFVPIR